MPSSGLLNSSCGGKYANSLNDDIGIPLLCHFLTTTSPSLTALVALQKEEVENEIEGERS